MFKRQDTDEDIEMKACVQYNQVPFWVEKTVFSDTLLIHYEHDNHLS